MDATTMDFEDSSFGGVFDKGTLDSMTCLKKWEDIVSAFVTETYRVLKPGGYFLILSCGDPLFRVPLL